MLNNRKDILAVTPPLLQVMADNSWHIILSMKQLENSHIECECIKANEQCIKAFTTILDEVPFYVAEGVWELNYGVQIMTLMHESLRHHPARQLLQSQQ